MAEVPPEQMAAGPPVQAAPPEQAAAAVSPEQAAAAAADQGAPPVDPKRTRRAVQDRPTQKAGLITSEDVSSAESSQRQAPVDLDDEDTYPWEKPASQEEQQEYENAVGAMASAIYDNDQLFNNLMKMVGDQDPQSGLIKAAVTLVTEVDKQIDLPESIIPALPAQALDMVYEMAVKSEVIEEMSDEDMQTTVAAAQEMIMKAYGMDVEDFGQLTQGLTKENVNELEGIYNESVQGDGFTKKVR